MKEKSNASALTRAQTRASLLPDANVSAPRRERVWDEARLHTVPRSLTSIGEGGREVVQNSEKSARFLPKKTWRVRHRCP